jgi:hypothetical protein
MKYRTHDAGQGGRHAQIQCTAWRDDGLPGIVCVPTRKGASSNPYLHWCPTSVVASPANVNADRNPPPTAYFPCERSYRASQSVNANADCILPILAVPHSGSYLADRLSIDNNFQSTSHTDLP